MKKEKQNNIINITQNYFIMEKTFVVLDSQNFSHIIEKMDNDYWREKSG